MPGSTQSRLPRSCNGSVVPMSERQQLKLVRQLETSEVQGSTRRVNDAGSPQSRGRSCNGRGETPLHRAAIKGDYDLVVKLLEEGADPNTTDFAGWTPLHEACNHGWYAIALALLQAGASVNARGFDDITPLHDAAINGHSKLVCLLLESGADVHSRNKRGKTPCDVAAPELRPHLLKSYSSAEDSTRVKLKLSQVKKKSKNSVSEDKEKPLFESIANMEEKNGKEDIYEFKSSKEATPVRGNSTSPDVDKAAPETKNEKSSESQAGGETESVLSKRTLSEMTENEENEDDVKKKKRKEGDGKEGGATKALGSTGRAGNVRNVSGNSDKGGKVGGHPVNKNASSATKQSAGPSAGNVTEKKSPSSPKGSAAAPAAATASNNAAKTESEQEEKSNSESEKVDPGPKVPPLKIVIPQQNSAEPEQGSRNGKNNTLRHHQALPYVVSSNSNDSEKESARSRSPSPSDSFKSDEKKDPAIGMLSAEDQKGSLHHQRVLRSSHRSGPGSNGESRSSDPGLPRTNNGNGQSSTSASGTATTPSSNSNNNNSSLSTATAENASPQSQNRSSPLPQVEANTPASTASSTATTESSTVSQPTTNYSRNSSNSTSKGNGNSSSTSNTGSEDKTSEGVSESSQTPSQPPAATPAPVELHPRKRKLKHNKEVKEAPLPQVSTERCETSATPVEVHPHDQPVKNCYQLFLDIRKQIERRRKGLFPVQPKPPQGFKDYLMNRCTYVLAGNASTRQIPSSPLPQNISSPMKDLFNEQEKERHRLRLQHVIEKEKLVLSVEQEILRVHGRAARALANQSLPFSACTILKDEEVYNFITPEQEEKDRNARSRYNGRLFLSWLQDVDDKWEKIKEAMLLRHHNEAESLHAVQKMDWEWKMKESGCCEFKSKPVILDSHVPMVHVSDDFDLLPA